MAIFYRVGPPDQVEPMVLTPTGNPEIFVITVREGLPFSQISASVHNNLTFGPDFDLTEGSDT